MLEYIWSVWRAIQLGLWLEPGIVQIADTHPNAGGIVFGVVMVAGISVLIGQSVILFANQVRPGRFALSLVINGLLLVAGWIMWSAMVWITGGFLFDESPRFLLVLRLIGLSYAPLVFGFLVLMPYLGLFVNRVLYTWSFLVALKAVALAYHVGFWLALACVGIGWLLMLALTATVGRPVVLLRNRIWHHFTGTAKGLSVQEILQQFAVDKSSSSEHKGDAP